MMNEKSYMTFEEFYNPKKQEQDDRSTEEILKDVKNTLDVFKGRWAS